MNFNINKANANANANDYSDRAIIEERLMKLSYLILNKKKQFIDSSRTICCFCVFLSTLSFLLIFYSLNYYKAKDYCNNDKNETINKDIIEICEIPSVGYWVSLAIYFPLCFLILISLYCMGNTEIIFDPQSNLISINKKKLCVLPSINNYPLSDFKEAIIESDSAIADGPKMATFNFYASVLMFKKFKIGLGLGRDCFCLHKKVNLIKKINNYHFSLKSLLRE